MSKLNLELNKKYTIEEIESISYDENIYDLIFDHWERYYKKDCENWKISDHRAKGYITYLKYKITFTKSLQKKIALYLLKC